MRSLSTTMRVVIILVCALSASASAQTTTDADAAPSSLAPGRAREVTGHEDRTPTEILRSARAIYIRPNRYIDAKYLEYKLGKLPEFEQWGLVIVQDAERADLVIEIHRRALNYIFTIVEPESSSVVVNGKVVAINGLVAAEDISREIIRRMRAVRALPASRPE